MSAYVLLNPAVKIRWTKTVSEETILAVYIPTKKIFSLNKKTLTLLELCDGTKTKKEITAEFKKKYPNTEIESIKKIMHTFFVKHLILEVGSPQPTHPVSCVECEYPVDMVTIEITNECNLRCLHCYNDAGPGKNYFSKKEIEYLVDSLNNINVRHISFSGGEPLLHPHFFDAVTMVRERGMSWSVFTNAVLIDETMAQTLVDYGIRSAATSLDGSTGRSHDFLRGVTGSFEKTVNAIQMLKGHNIPIEVQCSVYRKNLREIPSLLNLLKELNVDRYRIAAVRYLRPQVESSTSGAAEKGEYAITMDEFIGILPDVVKAECQLFGTSQIIYANPDCKNCGIATSSFMIKSDGSMVPCPQSDPHFFTFGNAFEDDILTAWDTADVLKKLRSFNYKSLKKCSTCVYQLYCNGGCSVLKYELYNDAFALDPYMCEMMEKVKPFLKNISRV